MNNPNESTTTMLSSQNDDDNTNIISSTMMSSSSSYSVLSEKVNRALSIRTDTPAMKAALDALSQLEKSTTNTSATTSTTNVGDGIVDSRNVRVAIEQDALQQALHLQDALKSIVTTVQEFRTGIIHITNITHHIKNTSYQTINVIPTTTSIGSMDNDLSKMLASSSSDAAVLDGANDGNQEQKLASVLMDAFTHRDIAQKRLIAMNEFMEKFDLSERDNYLLDQYNFEDRNTSNNKENEDGIAFLKALERVRKIRQELQKQTIIDSTSATTYNDSDHAFLDSSSGQGGGSSMLRMMENLAEKQERAYERLYHWLQKYLHLHPNSKNNDATNNDNMDDDDDETSGLAYLLLADDSTNTNSSNFIKQALYSLRYVPAFYCHTIELIATNRRSDVTRRFLVALTAGYNNLPPIEMKSHDSYAYVGDMLAFAFKAFSVEADIAKRLLEFKSNDSDDDDTNNNDSKQELRDSSERSGKVIGINDDADNNDDDDYALIADDHISSFEKVMGSREMLSISMSGLARPLKSRILQVIASLSRRPGVDADATANRSNNVVMDDADDDYDNDGLGIDEFGEECSRLRNKITNLYDICGLLLFYISVMNKSIEKLQKQQKGAADSTENISSNTLVTSLIECFQEGTKAYEATVRVYSAMLEQWSVMTGESESALIHSLLLRIADVRMNSPGYSSDIIDEGLPAVTNTATTAPMTTSADNNSYGTILSIEWVTETLIESCLNTKCKSLDDVTYLKQSLAASNKAGMSIVLYEKLNNDIAAKEQALIDELVAIEAIHVLDLCGLGPILSAYKQYQDDTTTTKMVSYPGLSQANIESCMKDFYSSLYSPPLPTLESSINDPIVRRIARTKICDSITQSYSELYHAILSNQGGYKDAIRLLEHPPEKVKTLFSA